MAAVAVSEDASRKTVIPTDQTESQSLAITTSTLSPSSRVTLNLMTGHVLSSAAASSETAADDAVPTSIPSPSSNSNSSSSPVLPSAAASSESLLNEVLPPSTSSTVSPSVASAPTPNSNISLPIVNPTVIEKGQHTVLQRPTSSLLTHTTPRVPAPAPFRSSSTSSSNTTVPLSTTSLTPISSSTTTYTSKSTAISPPVSSSASVPMPDDLYKSTFPPPSLSSSSSTIPTFSSQTSSSTSSISSTSASYAPPTFVTASSSTSASDPVLVAVTSSSTSSATTFVSSGVTLYGTAAAAALAADATGSSGTNATEVPNSSGHLSTLVIFGIVLGGIVLLGFGLCAWFQWRKRRDRVTDGATQDQEGDDDEKRWGDAPKTPHSGLDFIDDPVSGGARRSGRRRRSRDPFDDAHQTQYEDGGWYRDPYDDSHAVRPYSTHDDEPYAEELEREMLQQEGTEKSTTMYEDGGMTALADNLKTGTDGMSIYGRQANSGYQEGEGAERWEHEESPFASPLPRINSGYDEDASHPQSARYEDDDRYSEEDEDEQTHHAVPSRPYQERRLTPPRVPIAAATASPNHEQTRRPAVDSATSFEPPSHRESYERPSPQNSFHRLSGIPRSSTVSPAPSRPVSDYSDIYGGYVDPLQTTANSRPNSRHSIGEDISPETSTLTPATSTLLPWLVTKEEAPPLPRQPVPSAPAPALQVTQTQRPGAQGQTQRPGMPQGHGSFNAAAAPRMHEEPGRGPIVPMAQTPIVRGQAGGGMEIPHFR